MMDWSQPLQGQHNAFIWFTESQLQSVIKNGVVPEWFHGIISRKTAEELLMSKPPGYFLIRVSESRIGYTLSYRAEDRCRHFMIDALDDGHYIVVGENRRHRFLQDLVDFHRRTPIVPFNEVLTVACGQSSNDKTDYAELLFPQRPLNPNMGLLPNNSLHPSTSHPISPEDVPPALPFRPNNLRNSAVLSSTRLYPSLEEEFPHPLPSPPATSQLPATPVPMTRNRYITDIPPSNQRPEVPARTSVPPLKQNQACIRTVSAPDTQTAGEQAKPSVVTNLRNLKKKFQKKRSTSQVFTQAEVNVEASDRSGNIENEYQEITGVQTFNGASAVPHTCPDARLAEEELPYEYQPPPPFAPGY